MSEKERKTAGARFSIVLLFDAEVHGIDDMDAIVEAVDSAEAELADVGTVKRVADRFYLPGSKVGKGETNAEASKPVEATETKVEVSGVPATTETLDPAKAVKLR